MKKKGAKLYAEAVWKTCKENPAKSKEVVSMLIEMLGVSKRLSMLPFIIKHIERLEMQDHLKSTLQVVGKYEPHAELLKDIKKNLGTLAESEISFKKDENIMGVVCRYKDLILNLTVKKQFEIWKKELI